MNLLATNTIRAEGSSAPIGNLHFAQQNSVIDLSFSDLLPASANPFPDENGLKLETKVTTAATGKELPAAVQAASSSGKELPPVSADQISAPDDDPLDSDSIEQVIMPIEGAPAHPVPDTIAAVSSASPKATTSNTAEDQASDSSENADQGEEYIAASAQTEAVPPIREGMVPPEPSSVSVPAPSALPVALLAAEPDRNRHVGRQNRSLAQDEDSLASADSKILEFKPLKVDSAPAEGQTDLRLANPLQAQLQPSSQRMENFAHLSPGHSYSLTAATQAHSAGAAAPASRQLETLIDSLVQARESGRSARGDLFLRHSEFGAISVRIADQDNDLRATVSSRDPGFAPAVQAALTERSLNLSQDNNQTLPRQHDQFMQSNEKQAQREAHSEQQRHGSSRDQSTPSNRQQMRQNDSPAKPQNPRQHGLFA